MTMMSFIGMCPLEKCIQDEIAPAVAWVKNPERTPRT